jgi:PKD repeat protein
VDAANSGDVIKVASGTYTGVHARAGVTQVVYVSKTVTIRGGYTTANWSTSDPEANPTTLDAQEQGRVLYITGDISPTVEGLRITGGYVKASGGGIYNKGANLTLINTIVTSNISNGINWPDGLGGGMYIETGNVVLSEVQIISNSASYKGGGVLVWSGSVMLSGGQISHNTAKGPTGWDGGGGMFVLGSATLNGVQVISNTAIANGGGLYVYQSNVTVNGGQIIDNSAWGGGGVFIFWSGGGLTLSEGQIISNTADYGGGVYTTAGTVFTMTGASSIDHNSAIENGGGVYVEDGLATLSGGQIRNNSASRGGGVYVSQGRLTLSRGHIVSNTASQDGGGIFVWQSTANAALTNSVVADNRAAGLGSGLYIESGSFRLLHTTIARNLGGDGSGVHAAGSATMVMTNTILVSHSVGITVSAGNTVALEATLWGTGTWANLTDWGGAGAIFTGTINLWDYPAFVDPHSGDYHIGPNSAAIDEGIKAGVTSDIDGEPRPMGHDYDIGADELRIALAVSKRAAPDPVQAGAQLTFTLRVTNTGNMDLHATITDFLPAHVTPGGVLTWTPTITAPGGVWTETVVVTVELGYVGTLTNLVEVTTTEGVSGTDACTVTVEQAIRGLAATSDSPTTLGQTTTLTATITSGSNVTYTWALGDGEPDSGAVVTHIYSPTGFYTAVVTASNPVSLITATTTITVEEAITGLAAFNDGPTPLGQVTTLSAAVNAGSNVVYAWDLGDGEPGSGAVVAHTYPSAGVYTAVVTASNAVNALTTTTTVIITGGDAALPSLSINDVSVFEGDSGPVDAVFSVTLSLTSSQPVTVQYATVDGSAKAPDDYTAISATLTFLPEVTARLITVSVQGDSADEADENFRVNLHNPINAILGDAWGDGLILDDDYDLYLPLVLRGYR